MSSPAGLTETLELMRDLRRRCDWDAAQTHESLRPYLIEEAYELEEALQIRDDVLTREELGDVLLQVLFHSVLAEERGAFTFADVAEGLITKMKARHPHLYGDGVKQPWEQMKSKRRASIGEELPASLPSLHRAQRLQDRAAGVGFDWPDWHGAADKVAEELKESRELLEHEAPRVAPSGAPVLDERHAEISDELGDLLFSCVNLCRKAHVHPALALDQANAKFQRRFESVERMARERGMTMTAATPAQLDDLWEAVKSAESP
ncbi:MAG: nucleoside triphosphate pyrophosphohydrolase [Gemmatimonadaceae bacterium]